MTGSKHARCADDESWERRERLVISLLDRIDRDRRRRRELEDSSRLVWTQYETDALAALNEDISWRLEVVTSLLEATVCEMFAIAVVDEIERDA